MSKQNDIMNFINTVEGQTFSTSQLCDAAKCTLPTVLTFIKNNPSRFTKVRRGIYTVNSTISIAETATETPAEVNTFLPSSVFDWD
jgi:hypothetical protein